MPSSYWPGAFGFIGLGFTAYGLVLLLAEYYPPTVASFIVAAGLFVLTGIFAVLAVWYASRTRAICAAAWRRARWRRSDRRR